MATHTVVALFDDYREAESAIRDLETAGIPPTDISLIANNADNKYGDYPQYGADRIERTGTADTGAAPEPERASGRCWGAPPAFLPGSGRWQSRGSAPWWRPERLLRRSPEPASEL